MREAAALEVQNQGLAGLHGQVVAQVVVAASEDVLDAGGVADDLFVALDVEGGGLGSAVEDSHHGAALILSGYNIDALVANELLHRALRDDVVALTPVQQA